MSGGAVRKKLKFKTTKEHKRPNSTLRPKEQLEQPNSPNPEGKISWSVVKNYAHIGGPICVLVTDTSGSVVGHLETLVNDESNKDLFHKVPEKDADLLQSWILDQNVIKEPDSVQQVTVAQQLNFTDQEKLSEGSSVTALVAFKHPISGLYLEVVFPHGGSEADIRELEVRFSAAAISPACEFKAQSADKDGLWSFESPLASMHAGDSNECYCLGISREGKRVCCIARGDAAFSQFVLQHQEKQAAKTLYDAHPETLHGIEKQQNKKYQSWGKGRSVCSGASIVDLEQAREKGNLQSLLLENRQKMKSDKYCK